MRKFLIALMMSLLIMSTANAEIETYTGTDDYTIGEHETQEEAENHSKTRALRNAQEQAGFFIGTYSQAKNFKLVKDEIVVIANSIMKVVGAPQYRKEILSDGKSILIHTTIKVQIDTNDLDRRLAEIGRQQNPAPPVEQPKPVEQPANPPAPPQEKIKPTAPVENVTPPPMDDRALANEFIRLLNAEREKAGRKPFMVNEVLTNAAKIRAEELSRKPGNVRPNGQNWSTAVPMPYRQDCWHDGFWSADSPQQILDWYMSQKSERKRILGSHYNKIGVAHFYKENSEYGHYWCILTSSR